MLGILVKLFISSWHFVNIFHLGSWMCMQSFNKYISVLEKLCTCYNCWAPLVPCNLPKINPKDSGGGGGGGGGGWQNTFIVAYQTQKYEIYKKLWFFHNDLYLFENHGKKKPVKVCFWLFLGILIPRLLHHWGKVWETHFSTQDFETRTTKIREWIYKKQRILLILSRNNIIMQSDYMQSWPINKLYM